VAHHRYRRYSVDFKLQLVRSYLSGEGSLKGIAGQYQINHSLLVYWLRKYQAGELTDEDSLADQVHEYEAQIAALERKVGQLTMELDALRRCVLDGDPAHGVCAARIRSRPRLISIVV